ncbi:membrane protein of unknown function [Legionella fallonii LLAP-10]|uniref:Uncharacterized protein n=1 Tax=Legionella fallonii LLAP-10 TaxID=1212491 RepID=A0A098G4Z9_9GAMM|nr:membrane protein of unknown function [Legionella fallonii LLAP-10]
MIFLSHYRPFPQLSPLNFAFFTSAVYLQMTYYYCVIRALPKILGSPIKTGRIHSIIYILLGAGFILFFKCDKSIYGILAMFHYLSRNSFVILFTWLQRVLAANMPNYQLKNQE